MYLSPFTYHRCFSCVTKFISSVYSLVWCYQGDWKYLYRLYLIYLSVFLLYCDVPSATAMICSVCRNGLRFLKIQCNVYWLDFNSHCSVGIEKAICFDNRWFIVAMRVLPAVAGVSRLCVDCRSGTVSKWANVSCEEYRCADTTTAHRRLRCAVIYPTNSHLIIRKGAKIISFFSLSMCLLEVPLSCDRPSPSVLGV